MLNILWNNFQTQNEFWCTEITALQQFTAFCGGGLVGGGHGLYHMILPCCTNITVSGIEACHNYFKYFEITTHYWLTTDYILDIIRENFYKQDEFWCSNITALQQITAFYEGGLVGGGHDLYHMTLPCYTNITVSGLGPCHIFLDILNLPHITTDQPQFTYQIS